MRFSVLGEFFGGFAVLDDFFFGFAVSNTPQCPLLSEKRIAVPYDDGPSFKLKMINFGVCEEMQKESTFLDGLISGGHLYGILSLSANRGAYIQGDLHV